MGVPPLESEKKLDRFINLARRNPLRAAVIAVLFILGVILVGFLNDIGTGLAKSKETSSAIIRPLFTDMQTVKQWSLSSDQNVINLDNAGTLTVDMVSTASSPSNSVTLILNAVPLITDNDSGHFGAYWFTSKDVYTFNSYESEKKSQEIRIGRKAFLVTLFKIRNIGSVEKPNFEYQFGISEQQ